MTMLRSSLKCFAPLASRHRILIGECFAKLRGDRAPWSLAGAVSAATIFLAVTAAAQSTGDVAIEIVFKVNGQAVTLADDVRDEVRNQADNIARHCGYDLGDQEEQAWRQALAEPSSIHLVYATPIEVRLARREILISEALFSLQNEGFLGQPLLHHNGRTTFVAKCSGTDMLVLMCMPQLKAYFPPGYQRNCHIVRQR